MDHKRRSDLMAGIRSRDTAPELKVRRIAHRMGLRFRLHHKVFRDIPDTVFPELRLDHDHLPRADECNERKDDSLPPHGAIATGMAIPPLRQADGGVFRVISRWVILPEHRFHPDVRRVTVCRRPQCASIQVRNEVTVLP